MIGEWQVQKALVAALKAAGVAAGRIYDLGAVPSGPTFPYVEIGEADVFKDDVSGAFGSDVQRDLHIWSRHDGQKELFEVAAAIEIAVSGRDLGGIPGGPTTAFVYPMGLRTIRDPDGKTRHAVLTLKIQHHQPRED